MPIPISAKHRFTHFGHNPKFEIHRGNMRTRKAGFTLLETLVVIALVAITSSVAIMQMRTTMAVLDADKAANLVTSQISYARALAVDQRRNVRLDFLGNNQITVR